MLNLCMLLQKETALAERKIHIWQICQCMRRSFTQHSKEPTGKHGIIFIRCNYLWNSHGKSWFFSLEFSMFCSCFTIKCRSYNLVWKVCKETQIALFLSPMESHRGEKLFQLLLCKWNLIWRLWIPWMLETVIINALARKFL